MVDYEASVVIGFRDWGADRIERSVRSILTSFDGISAECIISDYGSSDPNAAKKVAEELSIGYVYTPGDREWSRSGALNAGFAIASGKLFISTDADMLFSPSAMRRIVYTAREAGDCALFLQCRDLPEGMGDSYFATQEITDWAYLERMSRLRPRWGMGGMMAIPAAGYHAIRGFDERLHTYGGEDLDFARRAQRAGYRTVWVDESEVRMYHMWHPPTIRTVEQSESGRQAVAFNKSVVYNDKTFVRNTTNWEFRPAESPPLISVAIATRNRPKLLQQAIRSVLTQTVADFEIIVVDDGSDDNTTKDAVDAFDDPRLRYRYQSPSGISAARNLALDLSRGQFTAVMDDDDLIPPQRFEWQLEAIVDGYVGSVGSFINFDDETGETNLIVSQIPTVAQALQKGGAPGHGTWLINTEIMRTIRYDETITSGVDNNFFLRLLRIGYRIAHCGKPVLLRRRHSGQITNMDSANQTDAAKQALQFLRFNMTNNQLSKLLENNASRQYPDSDQRDEMVNLVKAYLPDHLVQRLATVESTKGAPEPEQFDGNLSTNILTRDDEVLKSEIRVENASYADLARLGSLGTNLRARAVAADTSNEEDEKSWILEPLHDFTQHLAPESVICISDSDSGTFPGQGIHTYEWNDGMNRSSIRMRTVDKVSIASREQSTWIYVGVTAEEYWS